MRERHAAATAGMIRNRRHRLVADRAGDWICADEDLVGAAHRSDRRPA